MLRLARLFTALFLCCPLTSTEAATYKCTDGRQITYANVPCEDMNLKPAGPIKNLVTVLPAAEDAEESEAKNGENQKAPADKATDNNIPDKAQTKPLPAKTE